MNPSAVPPLSGNNKTGKLVYVTLAILVIVILVLGYIIFRGQGVSTQQTGPTGPGSQQAGTGTTPRDINTEKIRSFAESIESFNLKQNSYEQAEIILFNSGTVTAVGPEDITEEGVNYAYFLSIKNDEGEEMTYRFTEKEASYVFVILARRGVGGGEKITFNDIKAGDDISIQRVIDILEQDSADDGISITVRR